MPSTSGLLLKDENNNLELKEVSGATKYVLSIYFQYSGLPGEKYINGGFVLRETFNASGKTQFHAIKFIDSVTALNSDSLGLKDYKSGAKYHDDTNNLDYYYVIANDVAYYVFDNPLTIEGDKMALNGEPTYTLMVYNEGQLICYETVKTSGIVSK